MSRLPYDEMGAVRGWCGPMTYPSPAGSSELLLRESPPKPEEADLAFHRVGITSAVSGEESGAERLIPFDIVPRIIPANESTILDRGLRPRVRALNAFQNDVYHDHAILDIPGDRLLRHPLTDLPGNTHRTGFLFARPALPRQVTGNRSHMTDVSCYVAAAGRGVARGTCAHAIREIPRRRTVESRFPSMKACIRRSRRADASGS